MLVGFKILIRLIQKLQWVIIYIKWARVHYQGQDVELTGLANDMNVLIDNTGNKGEVTLEPAMTGVIQNVVTRKII